MIDISHPDQRRLFLKAKTRALIAEFGVEAAAELTGRGTSTVSRWQHPDTDDSIPADCMAVLEVSCGKPIVSGALASLNTGGARAGAGAHTSASACAHEACVDTFADLATSASGLNTELAIAISDGNVTPTECRQAIELISATRRYMDDMEHALVRASGPRAVPALGSEGGQ